MDEIIISVFYDIDSFRKELKNYFEHSLIPYSCSILAPKRSAQILSFCLTPGNVDDRSQKVMGHLTTNLFGKLFADKGYVSKKRLEELLDKGVELITKQKKNAKNQGMLRLSYRLLLLCPVPLCDNAV